MIAALAITGQPSADPLLDWAALIREGRDLLAAMSDGGWTDFNAHDPGITILEVFAYALTDLGYRTQHPMADLLAGATPPPGPAEMLTTRAVTLTDLARLGLDVAGARAVWIEPDTSAATRLRYDPGTKDVAFDRRSVEATQAVQLQGVHQVLIEQSAADAQDAGALARAVAARFHAERNLCEDFGGFAVLGTQAVVVTADLEITDPARADEVLAAVLAALEAEVAPQPTRRAAASLRATGQDSARIYEGPRLTRGITDPRATSTHRRSILHLSDIIAALSAVGGVRATRRVRFGLPPEDARPAWSLAIDPDRVPRLDPRTSHIRLYARGALVRDTLAVPAPPRLPADTASADVALPERALPPGRDRHLGEYRPLRHDLPAVYGVRPGGLGLAATPERRAQANQLRAYLAILDGLLANGFAQLAGAASLLGTRAGDVNSYFAQFPEPPGDEAPLYASGFNSDALQAIVEHPGAGAAARRARFLAHLLARVGETAPAVPQPDPEALMATRAAFLADMPRLTAGRGSGANLLVDGDKSPVLDRIRLKLGLPAKAAARLLLVEHILLRGITDDEGAATPLLSAARRADPWSLQLSLVLDASVAAQVGENALHRVVRDEVPAHLVIYFYSLGALRLRRLRHRPRALDGGAAPSAPRTARL